MLTETPDNYASSYQCGRCGIYGQILTAAVDSDGNLLYREDGSTIYVNDEPAAVAEMNEHMQEAHPEPAST